MIWQVWEQDLMDWYSYMLPPENVVQLLKATGVDCASVPCGWEPMTHKFLGAKGTAISLGLKEREIKNLKVPEIKVEKMLELVDWYIKACKGTKIGVGVNLRSCFTNTSEVLGMEKFLIKLYRDTEQIEHLFDIFTDYSIRITKGLSNRPINCFWIDDDLCTNQGFFVNPKFIKKYWIPRTETILEPIKKKGIPIFMHCCGNVEELLPIIIDMGIVGIHPIQPNCNDIYKLKEKFGNKITFFGNMDIAGVLAFGTPEEVIEDTKTHINKLAPGGGYVVASSHSIIDRIPYENYIAMIKTAQSCTNY
jgi:uroporphyrinogen decarboxylase